MTKQMWMSLLAMTACGVDEQQRPEADDEVTERFAYTPLAFARVNMYGVIVTQMNSAAGATTVSSPTVGVYEVTFHGFPAGASGGNFQGSAEGTNNVRCRLENWSGAASVVAQVRCASPSGALADSPFSILYHRYAMPAPNPFSTSAAYVYVTAHGVVQSAWDYNSSGVHNTVTKYGTGRYRVYIPNATSVNASMMVTPVSSTDAVCSIVSWGTGYVNVDCAEANAPVDSGFSFSFSVSGPAREQQGGHAWFGAGGLDPMYASALGKVAGCSVATVTSTSAPPLATVSVNGNLGSWNADPFLRANFVSGYGTVKYCKVETQSASGVAPSTTASATVRCYLPNGTVVPQPTFTFTHVTSDAAGPC